MFGLRVDDEIELTLPIAASADKAYPLVMANYDHLSEWMPWVNESFTLESEKDYYRRTLQSFASEGSEMGLNIFYKGEIVGGTGLHKINRIDRSAEIGYWLAKGYTGRGIMTRSVRGLLDYGFDEMNLNRIVIKCVPENVKSRAVPERLGFKMEGIEREAGWLHTRFVDHVVYSILAKEWKK